METPQTPLDSHTLGVGPAEELSTPSSGREVALSETIKDKEKPNPREQELPPQWVRIYIILALGTAIIFLPAWLII